MIEKTELDDMRDRLQDCLLELGDRYPEGADNLIQYDLIDALNALNQLNDDLLENDLQYNFRENSLIR